MNPFVADPQWGWWIVLYFYLGGIAAGAYFLATLIELFGREVLPDEEPGGAMASATLAASGRLGQDGLGMLLPEPTSGVVWNASRGALTLEVTVRGRAAHVGLMQHGTNAVERALPNAGFVSHDRRETMALDFETKGWGAGAR